MMTDQKGGGNNTSLTQTRMVHRKGGSRHQFPISFHQISMAKYTAYKPDPTLLMADAEKNQCRQVVKSVSFTLS